MLVSFNFSPDVQVVEDKGFAKTMRYVSRLKGFCSCAYWVERVGREMLSAQERLGVDAYCISELSRVRAESAPM